MVLDLDRQTVPADRHNGRFIGRLDIRIVQDQCNITDTRVHINGPFHASGQGIDSCLLDGQPL